MQAAAHVGTMMSADGSAESGATVNRKVRGGGGFTIHKKVVSFSLSLAADALD